MIPISQLIPRSVFVCLSFALVIPVWVNGALGVPAAICAAAAGKPAQNTPLVPSDTPILARLTTEVNIKKCQLGERVEAQVIHDVKVDKQTVIKRGAHVVGKVTRLQATPDSSGMYKIGILFDTVEQKNSAAALQLEVQALAPPPTEGRDDANDPRGMEQTEMDSARIKGQLSGAQGPQGELTDKSRGPIGLPGLGLSTEIAQGVHTTIFSFNKDNIRLAKDSQVVFKAVNP